MNLKVYAKQAQAFAVQYEQLAPEAVHADWLSYLPKSGKALDIGAGTGRDAAWLVKQGLSVYAVEPVAAMRQQAEVFHPDSGIHWIDDTLPLSERMISSIFSD
ncbi:methyltransferase domain-containing protein [Deltaproteobacteria bacterium TL4]